MRSFMRGNRAPATLFVCTAAAVMIGLMLLSSGVQGAGSVEQFAQIGRGYYRVMLSLEGVIVLLLAPLLTAGVISREYERQTIESLILTRLSAWEILAGKLVTSLGFFAMVLLCLAPVLVITSLLGGVSLPEIVFGKLLLLTIACCSGAMGCFYSASNRNSISATIITFFMSLVWLGIVIPLLTVILPTAWYMRRMELHGEEKGSCLQIASTLILSVLSLLLLLGLFFSGLEQGRWDLLCGISPFATFWFLVGKVATSGWLVWVVPLPSIFLLLFAGHLLLTFAADELDRRWPEGQPDDKPLRGISANEGE